jgi:GT2 family glycosyltransferase
MTEAHADVRPLISFIVVEGVADPDALDATLGSLAAQLSSDWEVLVVGAAEHLSSDYPRVRSLRTEPGASAIASMNRALRTATGSFVTLVRPGDSLREDAVVRIAAALASCPDADFLYSDEHVRVGDDTTTTEFTKPEWSPERLLGQPYALRLAVVSRSLADRIGDFEERFEQAAPQDFVLRATEQAQRIVHVPHALYRVAGGGRTLSDTTDPVGWEFGRQAVQAALDRRGIAASAVLGPLPGTFGVHRHPGDPRHVSIVIPTRGTSGTVFGSERVFVLEAVRSVLAAPTIHHLEVVIVHDIDTPAPVLDALVGLSPDAVRLVPFDGPFNFSRKCNVGFLAAHGEIVVFLNDDTELITPDAIDRLVAPLREPDVGMTGAKLRYEDDSLQHAGHRYNGNEFTHAFLGATDDDREFGALQVNREVSGLTAACVALRSEVFEEVGGFFEGLPINFNDVDLSLKLRSVGYRLLWLAGVEFSHFESKSRAPEFSRNEVEILLARWVAFGRDPYTPVV